MERYYEERFKAQRRIARALASTLEVNDTLQRLREEIKNLIPTAMEACILMLDPDALKYTRPLQCALYDRPINCLSCKRNRSAVQKALNRKRGVVISSSEPIVRPDGAIVKTGPEAAIPVFVGEEILAVITMVLRPEGRFSKKEFYLLRDLAETAGNAILRAKRHWEVTQEKLIINQMLAHLSPFVPHSVRQLVETNPDILSHEKESKEVTVLFLDLEDYTRLSMGHSEREINKLVETLFSHFVDPIHRSGGDINETAGDGLMILFKNHDAAANAVNAVRAAFDIDRISTDLTRSMGRDFQAVHVNMGINSGTALLGMTRFAGALSTRMTYTATGTVTNVAARLADLARGGDIIIGEETRRLISDLWPVYDRGLTLLKGVDAPVHVFSMKRA